MANNTDADVFDFLLPLDPAGAFVNVGEALIQAASTTELSEAVKQAAQAVHAFIPRWTVQKQQSIDSQNQQFLRAAATGEFYFVPSSGRKSVWTLVRQLRGPHLSTWA